MNSLSNWENTFMRIAKKNKGHFCVPILLWNEFYFFKQANHVYLLLCMLKNNASCHCCFFYRKWRTTFSPCSRKVLRYIWYCSIVCLDCDKDTGRYLPGWATVPSLSLSLFRNLIRRVLCHEAWWNPIWTAAYSLSVCCILNQSCAIVTDLET